MLTAVAEMLLNCCAAPEQILDEAMKGLKGSPVRDPFGPISAVRAVVKAAIARNKAAAILRVEPESADLAKQETFGTSTAGILPWPERAVYFLREDLRYSRRDTALLLGMSDANIDQLYEIAAKRIGYSDTPSFSSFTFTSRG